MVRAPVTVATAIAGSFVFQGCKNDAYETQSQQLAEDAIKSYEDLIKTDHTAQQCRYVKNGKVVDASGAEFTSNLAAAPAFEANLKRIDALREECLKTAKDAVKKGSETGFSRSKASRRSAIATPPKTSSTADDEQLLNKSRGRRGTQTWFDDQNRSPGDPGVRGAVVTVSTTAHQVAPGKYAVHRQVNVHPVVEPQAFFPSDIEDA